MPAACLSGQGPGPEGASLNSNEDEPVSRQEVFRHERRKTSFIFALQQTHRTAFLLNKILDSLVPCF
jgi:hypothetical protein